MKEARPNCLVLTLYSGENEYESSVAALRAQSWPHWEQRIFEHLPSKQAHDALYAEIMARSGEFSLFAKLDADMVLSGPDALESMVRLFIEDPELDHAVFALDDYMSNSPMMGLHVFTNRVRWRPTGERLFVDPNPAIPGHRRLVREAPAPVGRHAPDPSPYQAFHFGVHRGLKAFQPGREATDPEQAYKQWSLLTRVWRHFEACRDPRLGLAILGADLVWRGALADGGENYGDDVTRQSFARNAQRSAADLHRELSPRWRQGPGRALRWLRSGGVQVARGLLRRPLRADFR